LFVCSNHPLSANNTGASALNFSHLSLLRRCFPQSECKVIVLDHLPGTPFYADDLPAPGKTLPIEILPLPAGKAPDGYAAWLKPGYGLMQYFFPFATRQNLLAFRESARGWAPDLIWSEDLVANYFSLSLGSEVPVVYGHHDSRWKISLLKNKPTFRNRLKIFLMRRLEEGIIRRNAFLVGGSASELHAYAAAHPWQVHAYLPSTYEPVALKGAGAALPHVVHLGTMHANANRIGLERFLEVCWPAVRRSNDAVRLSVIGDLSAAGPALKTLLKQDHVDCTGFVADLGTVMRPYDIHVIPYEHDTGGTRTRLPLALNYNQLLIAHRNACRGITGLVHRENCLLAGSLPELTELILAAVAGTIDRNQIADQGKQLFAREFTVQGQQDRMKSFVSAILRHGKSPKEVLPTNG
jgi:hypothetical protein